MNEKTTNRPNLENSSEPSNTSVIKTKFECPPSFQQVDLSESVKEEFNLHKEDFELWLIQAPLNLSFSDLHEKKISLRHSSKFYDQGSHFMTQVSRNINNQEISVLFPNSKSGCYSPGIHELKGQISIIESTVEQQEITPEIKPKSKIPLPDGLKQRFLPFGSDFLEKVVIDGKKKHSKKKKKSNKELKKHKRLKTEL